MPCIGPSSEEYGMLTRYGDEVQLPRTDLAYVAFQPAAPRPCARWICAWGLATRMTTRSAISPRCRSWSGWRRRCRWIFLADVWARHKEAALHAASQERRRGGVRRLQGGRPR